MVGTSTGSEEPSILDLLHQLDRRLDQDTVLGLKASGIVENEEEIEQQIALSRRILYKARFRLNARRPINCLPFELLVAIFSRVQNQDPWSSFPLTIDENTGNCYSWLAITAVCHHWRRVSLAASSLWAKIYLAPGVRNWKGTENLLLERAQSYPISLYQHLRPHDLRAILLHHRHKNLLSGAMQRCAGRVRSMYLTCSSGTVLKASHYCKNFEHDFLRIEDLHLDLLFDDHAPVSTALQRMLRAARCSLHRLSLSNVLWPLGPTGLLPHLTHLSLKYPKHQESEADPTFGEFLDMLQNSPQLQFLSLHDARPTPVDFHTTGSRVVQLPRLRRIEISWTDSPRHRMSRLLLGHLSIKKSTEILLYALWQQDSNNVHSSYSERYPDFLVGAIAHLPSKPYLECVSTLQVRRSEHPAILLRGRSMCIESRSYAPDVRQIILTFSPRMPNASTLVFDQPILEHPNDISIFYAPCHFKTIQFLRQVDFLPLCKALLDPQKQVVFPTPPNEVCIDVNTALDACTRYAPNTPIVSSKKRTNDPDPEYGVGTPFSRDHLGKPPFILRICKALPKPPFEVPLRVA